MADGDRESERVLVTVPVCDTLDVNCGDDGMGDFVELGNCDTVVHEVEEGEEV